MDYSIHKAMIHFLITLQVLFFASLAQGQAAVTSAEYQTSAVFDSEVLNGAMIETWAKLYRPADLGTTAHPLIIFLHGNHPTCGSGYNPIIPTGNEYTASGTCPAGSHVINSHLGYEYLANQLAEKGYLVVSINTNRGINGNLGTADDPALTVARGRLVLRHLYLLSMWNHYGNAPDALGDLQGKIDFSHVGLMGHSRGGEAVRVAYNLYNDTNSPWADQILDPIHFDGIFEIGPIDASTSRNYNASNTAWSVILPMCDGDVSDLEGMLPFDRMLFTTSELPANRKSTYAAWGANHNYFNTEWQTSDSTGCVGHTPLWSGDVGSTAIQQIASQSLVPFFVAHVGSNPNPALENEFDPLHSLIYSSRIDRAFILTSNDHVVMEAEDFSGAPQVGSLGQAMVRSPNVTLSQMKAPEHSTFLKVGKIEWTTASSTTYFQDNWKPAGEGYDLSSASTFDFRISQTTNALNSPKTDFHLQFEYADHSLSSPVALSSFASVVSPVGGTHLDGSGNTVTNLHSILQTVRIPLSILNTNPSQAVRGVRLIFDVTSSGSIYLSNLAFSRFNSAAEAAAFDVGSGSHNGLFRANSNALFTGTTNPYVVTRTDHSVRTNPTTPSVSPGTPQAKITQTRWVSNDSSLIEIEVYSATPFPVRDALPILRINGKLLGFGGISKTGNLHFMNFKIPKADLEALKESISVQITHRGDENSITHDLGTLQKSTLIAEP